MSEEYVGALAFVAEGVIFFCLQEPETVAKMGRIGKYFVSLFTGWVGIMSTSSVILVFIPLLFSDKFRNSSAIPAWAIWLGAALCFVFANFMVWNQEHEARLRAEQCGAVPDVALVWDWPENKRQENTLAGRTEKDILIHNRSNEWIYRVRIAPISLVQEMTFDEINEIAPQTQHLALARWDGRASLTTNYVYFFGKEENAQEADKKRWVYKKTHNMGFSAHFLKIPMTVTYECRGTTWECVFDFNYNSGEESAFVKKSGNRISPSQAVGQNTGSIPNSHIS